MIALYPIKPIYTDKILSGEKTFELRRRLPKETLTYVLIYSTTPVGKVVGYAKVKGIKQDVAKSLWQQHSKSFGIDEADYFAYFDGCALASAIELDEVRQFVRPFSVTEITPDQTVPQSFCYVDKVHFSRLRKRKSIKV